MQEVSLVIKVLVEYTCIAYLKNGQTGDPLSHSILFLGTFIQHQSIEIGL
jgi:hypothetical protein